MSVVVKELSTQHQMTFTGNATLYQKHCLAGDIRYADWWRIGPPSLVKNGFCNDETNNAACNYDGGDCCININDSFCSECTCFFQENCLAGLTPSFVGDGSCNDETNNAACNYDGGDCCYNTCVIKDY